MLDVRPPTDEEMPHVARLAAALVRLHHAWDERRFFVVEGLESGYERFLRGQLRDPRSVVLAAVLDGAVCGYAYARFEDRDWNLLLDDHGALHDIYVDESARRSGVAEALLDAVRDRLTQLGAKRIVLSTAVANVAGRALFVKVGFRETMVEMTLEL